MEYLSILNGLILIYVIFRLGRIDKGKIKNIVLGVLVIIAALIGVFLNRPWIFFVLEFIILFLFDVFYDEEPLKGQILWIIPLFLVVAIVSIFIDFQYSLTITLGITLITIWIVTVQFTWIRLALLIGIYILLSLVKPLWLETILSILIFLLLDEIFIRLQAKFDIRTKEFQQSLLQSQYDEIKNIYLQMRGWRHDYHNHMQTMKAHLAANNLKALGKYLDELERVLIV